jgi:hypothetical protein
VVSPSLRPFKVLKYSDSEFASILLLVVVNWMHRSPGKPLLGHLVVIQN